ncbi:MAG TPA: hypothetical protein VD767_08975 [Thermomicrobiales bacterium]|nr:hypothetical protein [Thermomicrobiales bacterium]
MSLPVAIPLHATAPQAATHADFLPEATPPAMVHRARLRKEIEQPCQAAMTVVTAGARARELRLID